MFSSYLTPVHGFTYPNSRRIPYRRGIGTFLVDQFRLLRNLGAKAHHVVDHPARCRNLQYPGVVEGIFFWIEIRVGPDGCELGSSDGVCPICRFQVDGIADRRLAAAVLAYLAAVRYCDVVDLLMGLAFFVQPALDDLDAVDVCADGIA